MKEIENNNSFETFGEENQIQDGISSNLVKPKIFKELVNWVMKINSELENSILNNQDSIIDLYNTCYDIFVVSLRNNGQEKDLAKELYKNTSGDTVKQTSILKKSINELLIKYFDPKSVNSQSPGGL